jgi:hypothetical protein
MGVPLEVGDAVVYRSHPGAAPEDGVVTGLSSDASLAFVRYRGQHPGAPGKATPVSALTRPGPERDRAAEVAAAEDRAEQAAFDAARERS